MCVGSTAAIIACVVALALAERVSAQGPPLDPDKLVPKRREPVAAPAVAQPAKTTTPAQAAPKVWDMDKAIKFLDSHAENEYRKGLDHCARGTTDAIDQGFGGATVHRVNSARDFGPKLVEVGFKVHTDIGPGQLKKGDVVIYEGAKGHLDGHMAMHDGTQLVCQYKQKHFNPFRDSPEISYKVYRYETPVSGGTAPKSGLGGVLINPVAEKDSTPLDPELSKKLLEAKPGDSPVKPTIKLPKGKPSDAKDK